MTRFKSGTIILTTDYTDDADKKRNGVLER
jgi:hypothetical protein